MPRSWNLRGPPPWRHRGHAVPRRRHEQGIRDRNVGGHDSQGNQHSGADRVGGDERGWRTADDPRRRDVRRVRQRDVRIGPARDHNQHSDDGPLFSHFHRRADAPRFHEDQPERRYPHFQGGGSGAVSGSPVTLRRCRDHLHAPGRDHAGRVCPLLPRAHRPHLLPCGLRGGPIDEPAFARRRRGSGDVQEDQRCGRELSGPARDPDPAADDVFGRHRGEAGVPWHCHSRPEPLRQREHRPSQLGYQPPRDRRG
mmetsp:Transcript_42092/g.95927  ORF Transcript_42092/g.95927 Transcript_42092/m.95927 type:complete len:254 (+) Transcript_42092:615-1376(+)